MCAPVTACAYGERIAAGGGTHANTKSACVQEEAAEGLRALAGSPSEHHHAAGCLHGLRPGRARE